MKLSELRIGNLAICNRYGKKETIVIEQIFNHEVSRGIGVSFNGTFYSTLDIDPIPLNEEWLLKMGFKLNEFNTVSYLLKKQTKEEHTIYGLILDEDNCYGFYQGHSSAIDDWDSWTILKYVNTVHQLQNLYFSLTGEELTIKENS